MWIKIRVLLIAFARVIVAISLGGAIFWHVATHCGAQKGHAIVHVLTGNVTAKIDHFTYYIETAFEDALDCELKAGRHRLQLLRNDQVLYDQEFTVGRGSSVILMASESSLGEPTEPENKKERIPNNNDGRNVASRDSIK